MVLVDTYWHFGTHWYSEDLEKDDNCDDHEVKAAIKGWSGLVDNDERNDDDDDEKDNGDDYKEDDDEEGEDIGEEDDDEHEVKAVVESWSGLVTVGDAEEDDDDIR